MLNGMLKRRDPLIVVHGVKIGGRKKKCENFTTQLRKMERVTVNRKNGTDGEGLKGRDRLKLPKISTVKNNNVFRKDWQNRNNGSKWLRRGRKRKQKKNLHRNRKIKELEIGMLDILPNEILVTIFLYLHPKEILKLSQLKGFKSAGKNNYLWKLKYEESFGNSKFKLTRTQKNNFWFKFYRSEWERRSVWYGKEDIKRFSELLLCRMDYNCDPYPNNTGSSTRSVFQLVKYEPLVSSSSAIYIDCHHDTSWDSNMDSETISVYFGRNIPGGDSLELYSYDYEKKLREESDNINYSNEHMKKEAFSNVCAFINAVRELFGTRVRDMEVKRIIKYVVGKPVFPRRHFYFE